jgi:hypothetical protein
LLPLVFETSASTNSATWASYIHLFLLLIFQFKANQFLNVLVAELGSRSRLPLPAIVHRTIVIRSVLPSGQEQEKSKKIKVKSEKIPFFPVPDHYYMITIFPRLANI